MNYKGQFLWRNVRENKFTMVTYEGRYIDCFGICPDLNNQMPIIVYGKERKDGQFDADFLEFDDTSRYNFVQYFKGRRFKKIGESTAGKIYDAIHKKMVQNKKIHFADLPEAEVKKVLDKYKVTEETQVKILEQIFALDYQMFIYRNLKSDGGTFEDSVTVYQVCGKDGHLCVFGHPYHFVGKLPFKLLDSIGHTFDRKKDDPQRVLGVLKMVAHKISQNGSTFVSPFEFFDYCHQVESMSGKFEKLSDDFWFNEMKKENDYLYLDVDECNIYNKFFYGLEVKIAREIARLSSDPQHFSPAIVSAPQELDDDQRKALHFVESTGVKIITGGPGSGKTTLIKKIIEAYHNDTPSGYFALVAPTGRAAVRISESSGYPASTLHRLLGFQPFESGDDMFLTKYDKDNQMPVGLYIVDEMSMVGEELFLKFLEAVPTGSIIILSGDPRQLPSVEPGYVLKDLIDCRELPVQELTHIHRQGNGSKIIENYVKIRNYDSDLVANKTFIYGYSDKGYDSYYQKLNEFREKYDKTKKGDPYSFQILCFTRKGPLGTEEVNRYFVNDKKNKKNPEYFGKSRYAVGDKVMMTRNNYKEKYFNGDIGIITKFDDDSIYINFYDGEKRITRGNLPDVEHADAVTVHKSQGSEYDTVVIVIDSKYQMMLYNEIILTAVTRAKKRVIILFTGNGLSKSIENRNGVHRNTGLAEKIEIS